MSNTKTDAELLADALHAADAFREFYDRHARRVYAFHLRRSRDEDAAYDLTAETFAQAWLSRARFRDQRDGDALPWLFAIARNVLATSVRKRALELRARTQLGLLEGLRTPSSVEPDESWLDGAVDTLEGLPPAERDAVRLHVLDGEPYETVARVLATTPGAARVRVHRGLARLRRRLTHEGEAS